MTTKSTSAAKLPYRVDSGEALKIKDANGHSILIMMQVVHNLGLRDRAEVAATAAFLVLAANSHHAMKEALEEVMEWISGWDPTFIHDEEWPATRDRVLAALSLTKEI